MRPINTKHAVGRSRTQPSPESRLAPTPSSKADTAAKLLRFIVDSVPALIAYVDQEHRYVFVNIGYEKWFQRDRSTIVGRHVREIIGEEAYSCIRLEIEKAFTGETVSRECKVPYCTGSRWVRADYTPDRNEHGQVKGIVGLIIDITRTKRAELELAATKNKIAKRAFDLEQKVSTRTKRLTEVNRELESFTYSASHDLRSPLRKIDAYTQMVMDHCGRRLDTECKRYLGRVLDATRQMHQLIEDMLNLAGVTQKPLEMRDIDLSALAGEIVAELREADPRRKSKIRIDRGLRIRGDPSLWRIALWNLLDNAWKFTQKRACARIEFGSEDAAGEKVYVLRDNGAGFEPGHAHRMFEAFERLHRPEEFAGTGVGLAIARRAIERHGGRIWALGAVGKGASFYFALSKEPL